MDIEEDVDKSSLSHASFNYINSIIGSGIIGMPYAIHQAGLFAGLFLMILVAVITDYSLVIMVRGGQLSGSYNYQVGISKLYAFFLIFSFSPTPNQYFFIFLMLNY